MTTSNDMLMGEIQSRAWSKYIRNETKFDKWGALGKLLLVEEVLAEESAGPVGGHDRIANSIFPRTFYCERRRAVDPPLANALRRYFSRLMTELSEGGLSDDTLASTAAEETAEKFCLPVDVVRVIVEE